MPDLEELRGVEDRLRDLGRDLEREWPPVQISDAVLDRLDQPAATVRGGSWLRSRRAAVMIALAVALGIGATTPVGAAVARWLGFGGVAVEQPRDGGSSSLPSTAPTAAPGLTFEEAAALVGFEPTDADALGPASGIEVSGDRRVLSMTWTTPEGPLRLDQFDGELSWVWIKQAMPEDVQFTGVGTYEAVWFGSPHPLAYVDADGREHVEDSRLASPALVWVVDGVTRRLEGDLTHASAVALAESIG